MCYIYSEELSYIRHLTNALRIIYSSATMNMELLEGPLQRCFRGLQVVVGRGFKLEALSVHLVYLLLKPVLLQPTLPPGCELSIMILDHCWPQEEADTYTAVRPLLRGFMEILLHAIGRFRALEPPPEGVLIRLCTSVILSDCEWELLLSETGILAPEKAVRQASLKVILKSIRPESEPVLEKETLVWLSVHYDDEDIQGLAIECWSELRASVSHEHITRLLKLLSHKKEHIRTAAATALGSGLCFLLENSQKKTIEALLDLYASHVILPSKASENRGKGMRTVPQKMAEDLLWPVRKAVGTTLQAASSSKAFITSDVSTLLLFLLHKGVVDSRPEVREAMLQAGLALIATYGDDMSSELYSTVDGALVGREGVSKEEGPEVSDWRHEAAVVLLGAVGRHLDKEDPNVIQITLSLIEALTTPSVKNAGSLTYIQYNSLTTLCKF